MRQLTIEPGEKKPIAYCECCKKPLYKGDRGFFDKFLGDYDWLYCSMECLLDSIEVEIITLGE